MLKDYKPAQEDGDEEPETENQKSERQEKLRGLSIHLAGNRAEHIADREMSGIESEWKEDEEYYEGIDNANRGESSNGMSGGKPLGQASVQDNNQVGSTIFLNIVRPYCDAASAKFGEALMPTDDKAWEVNHTPIPDLIGISKGNLPTAVKRGLKTMFKDDEIAQGKEIQSLVDKALEELAEAKEVAAKISAVIEDWHIEAQYHTSNRIIFDDITQGGSGVLKGPFQVRKKTIAYVEGELVTEDKLVPSWKRISKWNLYPAPGCGQNIHNGSGIWECDDITHKELHGLIGVENYNEQEIMEVLTEGPHKATKEQPKANDSTVSGLKKRDTKKLYQIWYYHGMLTKEEMEAANVKHPGAEMFYDAKITMVNNRIIRAVLNPMETGDFPYDVMVWQRREGSPFGISLGRQIRTPQRMINAAARNLMNNAGLAGGPQFVINKNKIYPEDGVWEMVPLKFWIVEEDADISSIDEVFKIVTVPIMQGELSAIISLGLKFAELTSGLPMIMQGQVSSDTPDRVGIVNILDNNGSSVLRRVARLYDDLVTEPNLRRTHRYLLQRHEDDTLKRTEFQIDARGSSALVEKAQHYQALVEVAKLGLQNDPKNDIDPRKLSKEMLRSLRLDPKNFKFDDDEWKEMVGKWNELLQSMEAQGDPRTAIAQLNAQARQYVADKNAETQAARTEMIGAIAVGKMDMDKELAEQEAQLTLLLKGSDESLDSMNLEGDLKISADSIKAKLATEVMKIQNTLRLVRENARADQLPRPPLEPPGRAKAGESYTT